MKFRKKPVVIEAVQLSARLFQGNPIVAAETMMAAENTLQAFGAPLKEWKWLGGAKPGLVIPTLEGDHLAEPGDWIIRGVKGEYYPCKPDIFEATYEAVSQ